MSFLYSGSLWSSLYCGYSSLCVGLYRWLVKVSWLGKLVLVFWWVELDFFSLECNEVSSNELWDVYGFVVTLGSLFIGAQGCVPVLLENLLGMSCHETGAYYTEWRSSTIKRTSQTARIQKGHPKLSNINKMKRQRNTQQVKEQDKCPPNQRGRDRESTW